MKLQAALFILLIFEINSYCQTANFNFDQYDIKIENSKLDVTDKSGKLFLERTFNNPHDLRFDLDSDGTDEYILIDEKKDSGKTLYTLYIFNTVDSFYVADSIQSGCLEPYVYLSKETNKNIIVTGNSKFDSLNKDSEDTFVPINCWIYDNAEIFSVNDELYNIFISENEKLIDIIDTHFSMNSEDCKSTETIKAAIAAVYANYISAGEKILANQFLKKYYHCNDIEKFKQTLNELL